MRGERAREPGGPGGGLLRSQTEGRGPSQPGAGAESVCTSASPGRPDTPESVARKSSDSSWRGARSKRSPRLGRNVPFLRPRHVGFFLNHLLVLKSPRLGP